MDMSRLGERTITLDCDVIQADGGTRTASITGAYVALARALHKYGMAQLLTGQVAAVSVGIVNGPATSTSTIPRTPPPRSTSTWS